MWLGDKQYPCCFCKKMFSSKKGTFHKHLKNEHNLTVEVYCIEYLGASNKCKVCGNPTAFVNMQRKFREFCSLSCVAVNRCKNSTKEQLRKNSYALLKWAKENPEAKKRNTEILRKYTSDHEHQSKACTKRNEKLWNDGKYREKMSQRCKLLAQNPDNKFGKGQRHGIKGVHISQKAGNVPFDSYLERNYFRLLDADDSVLFYERPNHISYKYGGKQRHYTPDCLITHKNGSKHLVEVKPTYLLTDSLVILKASVAKEYAASQNYSFSFVTEKEVYKTSKE